MENLFGGFLVALPFILGIAYIIWYNASGRARARLERKREEEIETQMRLGMRDEERMKRVAERLAAEEEK